jgi:hypothetical protein
LATREGHDVKRSLKYIEKIAADYAQLFGSAALEAVVQV